MYRLLIADDEALEREGLEWIVNRMMPGIFEVIHAENGRTAIQKADEYRPHIILMDIRMPGIQGLEALKEIQAAHPRTKMVLVTAYEQFEYAKEALSLGVKEYLVKPAKRDHIVALLRRLVDEIDQERSRRHEELAVRDKYFQLLPLAETEMALGFMSDQVHETDAEQLADILGISVEKGCALVLSFPEPQHSPEHEPGREKKKLYDTVKSFAKGFVKDRWSCVVSSMVYSHMALFLLGPSRSSDEAMSEEATMLAMELMESVHRQGGLEISAGIGSVRSAVGGIRRSYYEAVFASTYHKAWGGLCRFDDLTLTAGEEAGEPDGNPGTGPALRGTYVELAIKQLREERERQTWNVLDRATAFIQEKFHEELSLEEVAGQVHLNPHYFSKVFKQLTGETFIDYVTRLRIERAKEWIADGQLSLKEVCYRVGYKDPNYFSRVFKKVTGVTPTEFRNQS